MLDFCAARLEVALAMRSEYIIFWGVDEQGRRTQIPYDVALRLPTRKVRFMGLFTDEGQPEIPGMLRFPFAWLVSSIILILITLLHIDSVRSWVALCIALPLLSHIQTTEWHVLVYYRTFFWLCERRSRKALREQEEGLRILLEVGEIDRLKKIAQDMRNRVREEIERWEHVKRLDVDFRISSLVRQRSRIQEHVSLIDERKSEYVMSVDIPIQLIQERREKLRELEEIDRQIDEILQSAKAESE
jgi:hypothetical protein